MHCQQCGAPMRVDPERGLFVCEYCRGEFAPPAEADGVLVVGESALGCPVCGTALSDGLLEQFSLKYCAVCHGMLIAMDDLPLLIEARRARQDRPSGYLAARDGRDADRRLKCPECGSAMDGHAYGGGGNVNIDSCENCSVVWLDGGELRKMVIAPDHAPAGEPIYLEHEHDRD